MRLLMGYFSCVAGSGTSEDREAAAAAGVVVVNWEGNLVRHEAPATVAELMLEAPGYLVASAEEATRTRRALALRADESLSPGGVYLLFPAGRAGSRVPDQQMAAALDLARSRREEKRRRGGRKSRAGGRVFPGQMACEEQGKKDEEEEEEEGKRKGGDSKPIFSGTSGGGGGGFRGVGGARPWRPVLETIDESV